MKTELYVFSATGNCLTTARKIAWRLEDCAIHPVAALLQQEKHKTDADSIGFVFPVYYGSMPFPVRALISKMVMKTNSYIFVVTTCRGHEGVVSQRMDQLLRTRGQKLSLWLNVSMPGNSFLNEPEVDQACLDRQDESIAALMVHIHNREFRDYSTSELLPLTPVDYPNNFRGLLADDSCVGCSACITVCPMQNIRLEDEKAVIGDNCTACLACFHWCPVEAIYMSKAEAIARRRKYRHPDVTMAEIAEQKVQR